MLKLNQLDRRLIDWDYTSLEDRLCPVCGESNHKSYAIRPDKLAVNLCTNCGLLYISPSPTKASLDLFYQNYHKNYFESNVYDSKFSQIRYRDEALGYINQEDPRISYLKKFINKSDGVNLLDFGCGTGKFLYAAKVIGANVFGIEYDSNAVNICHDIGLENVWCGGIQAIEQVSTPIDFIVLNDVIEHPLEPMPILKSLVNVLRKGGEILIWTPNGNWIFNDKEHTTLRVDLEHMQYITSGSVLAICNSLGLSIVHYEELGLPSSSNFLGNEKYSLARRIRNCAVNILRYTGLSRFVNIFRRFLTGRKLYPREGSYHLFIVLRK